MPVLTRVHEPTGDHRLARHRKPRLVLELVESLTLRGASGYTVPVELWEAPIISSAHRRNLSEQDIRHALHNLIAAAEDPHDEDVTLFLGPDLAVNLIEVGVLATDDGPLIIHASPSPSIPTAQGMIMARTIVEKEQIAAEIAERLAKQVDEPSWRDAEPLRRIAEAFRRSVAADAEVAEAVRAAREDGYSWAAVAAMLGVSKQTAQARYGRPPQPLPSGQMGHRS